MKKNIDKGLDNRNEDKAIPRWMLVFVYVVFFIQLYSFIRDLMP